MRLLEDWKDVLTKAWSIRLIAVAALLSGIEVALPLLDGILSIPRGIFAALSALTTAAAFIARLLAQRETGDA
jgi:hypothetical protein